MEPSQSHPNRGAGSAATLCTASTSSLAAVYLLTSSLPVTAVAAAVVAALSITHLVVRR